MTAQRHAPGWIVDTVVSQQIEVMRFEMFRTLDSTPVAILDRLALVLGTFEDLRAKRRLRMT